MIARAHPEPQTSHSAHITLDLPIPPSVNRLRRVDWHGDKARREFYLRADLFLTAYGPKPAPVRIITGAYELTIAIPEGAADLDNHCKSLIDYLVSREFLPGDNPRCLRRLVVEWIDPEICPCCRVCIRSVPP